MKHYNFKKQISFIMLNIICCIMLFSCSIFFGSMSETSTNSSTSSTNSGSSSSSTSTSSTTSTTIWSVTYNNTNGAVNPNVQTYKEADNITLQDLTLTGYTFDGWFDASTDGTIVTGWSAGTKTGNITLYARWTANTYTVRYNANDGTGSIDDQIFSYNEEKALSLCTFTPPADMKFYVWNTSADRSGTSYKAGESVCNLTSVNNKTITLYAIWIPANSFVINYENVGNADNSSNPITYLITENVVINDIAKTGYTFGGWFDASNDGTIVTGWNAGEHTDDITLWADWTVNTYSITYKDQSDAAFSGVHGSDNPTTHTYDTETQLVSPSKTGYTFGGWYPTSDCSGTALTVIGATDITSDITLYAKWTLTEYSITYNNTNGASNTNVNKYTIEDNVTLTDITNAGATFDGWFDAATGGDQITGWSAGSTTGNITLYAHWTYTASLLEDFESGTFTANSWVLGGRTSPAILDSASYSNYVYDGQYAVKLDASSYKNSSMSITVNLTVASVLKFVCKTDLSSASGVGQTFTCTVDDETVASPNELNGSWGTYSADLTAGTHTITFTAGNSTGSYWPSATNAAYIDNISINAMPSSISTLSENFESDLSDYWTLNAYAELTSDDTVIQWQENCHDGVINDNHGKVIRFNMLGGTGTATLKYIDMPSSGAITFDYKSQCHADNTLSVIIDGEKTSVGTIGSGYRWQSVSVPLSAGEHTIVISANKNTSYYYPSYTNAIYIDNVSVASDDIDSVRITPYGTQHTYIGGHTLQYSADALRSDGSVISDQSVSWSVSGGGSMSSSGLFTPTAAGTFTVTATINGVKGTSSLIVHSNNSADSITVGGYTFTGVDSSTLSGSTLTDSTYISFDTDKMPSKTTFSADGYFPMVGTVTPDDNRNAAVVIVAKDSYKTTYILQDSFDQRIWLRFGQGEYTVTIAEGKCSFYTDTDGKQGALSSWSYAAVRTLTVTNTNSMSADDAMYLLPSHYVNHDDYRIQNVVADVLGGLPDDAQTEDKLMALHDRITDSLYYDYSSIGSNNARRHQESIYVLLNGCAVCEGYANLYAALARQIGVKIQYISSSTMNHGWNMTYFDSDWHLTDVTWDDPSVGSADENDKDAAPGRERYTYFIIDGNTGHEEGTDANSDIGRGSPVPPKMLGEVLDGWY